MNGQHRGGSKKRKQAESLDAERSLYASFVSAANSVSQLYSAAVQSSKRSEEAGARAALERVAQFVLKEYGNAPTVPTSVIMEVLHQELQVAQGLGTAIQLPFPVPLLPAAAPLASDSSGAHHSDDEHVMSADHAPPGPAFRRSGSGHHISPPKARSGGGVAQLPALFQQHQQQQQMQQQAAAAQHHQLMMQQQQQQQQQHLQQQQQQQQQAGPAFMQGFPGQPPFHS